MIPSLNAKKILLEADKTATWFWYFSNLRSSWVLTSAPCEEDPASLFPPVLPTISRTLESCSPEALPVCRLASTDSLQVLSVVVLPNVTAILAKWNRFNLALAKATWVGSFSSH